MITVKGTQTGTESTDPAAAYARKPDERSGAVAKVGLLLAAVFLYLKAFLPGSTAASEDAPAGESPEEAANTPVVLAVSGGKQEDSNGPGTGGEPTDPSVPMPFGFAPEADSIAFADPERQVTSPLFRPAGYIATQANENGPPQTGGVGFRALPAAPGAVTGGGTRPPGGTPGDGQPVVVDTPPPADPKPGDPDGGPAPDEDTKGNEEEEEDGTPDPAGNRAPRLTGPVYLNDISGCAVLAIGLADMLRGAVDPDGDALSVADVATSSGELSMLGTGLWEFSSGGELGPVTITYRISDGSLAVTQSLHFAVVPAQSVGGTDQDDIMVGTMFADEIDAGAGDDLVDGRAGDDVIQGGDGCDHILAGAGDDVVLGGAGNDVIFGGAGDDEIRGGAGNDRLFGEAGADTLFGGPGDDTIRGGAGDDFASGGEGDDHLLGEAGADTLFGDGGDDLIEGGRGDDLVLLGPGDDAAEGGAGNDRLLGGVGNDHLSGGTGSDVLLGEAGNDTLEDGAGEDVVLAGEGNDRVIAAADGVDDRYDGGDGCDLLDYSSTRERVEVDLAGGRASGIEIGEDIISGFERIATGSGDDLIRIGGSAVSISGGEGCNTFEFAASGAAPASSHGPVRQTSYEIEDFKVGDRLRMSKWELFDEVLDGFGDRFERLYGDRVDEDDVPIRYQTDRAEDLNETIIEADLDGDNFYETAIILDGRHALVFLENA
jgi:Ca2+-binding RTX toxin-like protein